MHHSVKLLSLLVSVYGLMYMIRVYFRIWLKCVVPHVG